MLFHAIVGTIASTRGSIAAVTSWMPPPYEAPTMPISGSVVLPKSNAASGCWATQLMMACMSLPSNSGWSIWRMPPERHSPRGSHVTTL